MVVSEKVRTFFHSGSAIRRMFEEGLRLKARYGDDAVADLSIGNPAFEPPEALTAAFRRLAADPPGHAYMPNAGYPHVRDRVAASLRSRGFYEAIEGRHLVMTTGAAGAINVVLKTILEPGDEVIVLRPYFVEYRFYIDTHGGRMVLVDTTDDFGLDLGAIEAALTPRTKAIILNSPNNPTGRVYDRASLDALATLLTDRRRALGHRVFLLSDEPYRELLFDGTPYTSPASCYADSFMCYSWSKAFSIAGERIGFIAVHPEMEVDDWPLLMGSLGMCNRFLGFVNAPAFMQHVIAECVDAVPDIGHYADKRERLVAALDEGGYTYHRPEGAFYFFPRTPGPEPEFIERAKANLLLVVPGADFGRPGHFRLSFAVPDATIDLACRKLIEVAHS